MALNWSHLVWSAVSLTRLMSDISLNPESDIPSGTLNTHPDCLKCSILVFGPEVHHTEEGLWGRDKRIDRHGRLPLCPYPCSYLISIFTELISELSNPSSPAHFHSRCIPSSSLCSPYFFPDLPNGPQTTGWVQESVTCSLQKKMLLLDVHGCKGSGLF